jgi:hypothetical protein
VDDIFGFFPTQEYAFFLHIFFFFIFYDYLCLRLVSQSTRRILARSPLSDSTIDCRSTPHRPKRARKSPPFMPASYVCLFVCSFVCLFVSLLVCLFVVCFPQYYFVCSD